MGAAVFCRFLELRGNSGFSVVFYGKLDYGSIMSPFAKPFVWSTSLVLLAGGVHAVVPEIKDQPYKVILTRNAFGLKPPPEVVIPPVEPVGPPPNIKLTGIIAITSPKKAMFVLQPVGKAAANYLTINEGQEMDGLTVLEINERDGSVKIAMNGATSTLDFENNGIKTPFVAAPPTNPAGVQPLPGGGQAAGIPQGLPGGGTPALPVYSRPAVPPAPGQPATQPSQLQTIPTRPVRSQPQSQLGPAVPEKQLTVEQSVIMKKVDELVNQDKIYKQQ